MAGGEPAKQSGELVDALVEEAERQPVPENTIPAEDAVTAEPPHAYQEERIMAMKTGVKRYSRPTMNPSAVIGTLPTNMTFGIRGTARNPFGEFYKLSDGTFVSVGDAVKKV